MENSKEERLHQFEFPAKSGSIAIRITDGCFPDVSDEEICHLGRITRDFFYGLLLENKNIREHYRNIFHTILKDISISVSDKDLNALLRFAKRAFRQGDYENALFLSKLVLAHINKLIDNKIAHNEKFIDKEVLHLQISTLNFIGYIFSKQGKNIDYGLKLVQIAKVLLNEFDEKSEETLELKAAILDTEGALCILKKNWDQAIKVLTEAHQHDLDLLAREHIDPIGFRLTCTNLGYAIACRCNELVDREEERINIHEIEEELNRAKVYFMMVKVDKPPLVPEHQLKNLELICALKRMKQGSAICENVKSKLQKRLI